MRLQKISVFALVGLTSMGAFAAAKIVSNQEYKDVINKSMPGVERQFVADGYDSVAFAPEESYYDTYSLGAEMMLTHAPAKQFRALSIDDDPYYKNLRMSPTDFNTSFHYNELNMEGVRGYVPSGSYSNGAWDGLSAFFDDENLGVCRLQVLDASSYDATYNQKTTTHEVNGHPTNYIAEGSKKSGYLQTLGWTSDKFDYELICATKDAFSKNSRANMIKKASVLDSFN